MKRLPFLKSGPRVAVIRLSGPIAAAPGRPGGGPMLSDAALAPTIARAFQMRNLAAVALAINSPGGAPVQSALIAARIRRHAAEAGVPVHAFVEDVAASGGYWLALAADHIWADRASIVGSIGVISAGFGFQGLLARAGVERRVYTAGRSKSLADPFLPENPEDVARIKALQEPIHAAFIDEVKARRGARLAGDATLFEGDVWDGAQAAALGLVDGIAHLEPKMKELFGPASRFVPFGMRRGFLSRFGLDAGALADEMAARAVWARFGL